MTDADDVRRVALSRPVATQNGSGFEVAGKGFAWFYQEKAPGRRLVAKPPRTEWFAP
jgi:hypothetical protein